MNSLHFINALIMLTLLKTGFCDRDYTMVLQRIENIEGENKDYVDFSRVKSVRKGSKYFFNGTFEYLTDLDDSFRFSVATALSVLRNSRFTQQPIQIEPTSMCNFHNTTFRKYLAPPLKDHSNYPEIPPQGLCPVPKGIYFVKEVFFDDIDKKVLPSHVPKGTWRVDMIYHKKDKIIGGMRIFCDVV